MKVYILLIGSLLISLSFGVFFWLLQSRMQQRYQAFLNNNQHTRHIAYDQLSPTQRREAQADAYSLQSLLRATILNHNPETKTLSLLQKDSDEITEISYAHLESFKCWKAFFELPDGTELPVMDAFIPLNTDDSLYLEGESQQDIRSLQTMPIQGLSAILRIESGQSTIREFIILGCPD